MSKRYSDELLRKLRNDIPINNLIADILKMPSKISEGQFRFLCPRCKEFQTATNLKTNLGRCFNCEINFNPIEIVMAEKHMGFVDSVEFLKSLKRSDVVVWLKSFS